jgi:hypothetical protein
MDHQKACQNYLKLMVAERVEGPIGFRSGE